MFAHNLQAKANRVPLVTILFFVSLVLFGVDAGAVSDDAAIDFTELSLEDLINVEVVSVSKRAQRLSETDAAAFVITQDVLKRSGATSIMEALRMVPGIQVARIDANKWAISARGSNLRFSNKLLVLMDGRSIYSPLFSGVFWDMQDTMIEDIERIEVIRGPGATLWGANAVNGVINIITQKSKATQGTLITAGAGSEERGFGAVRYGGKTGADTHYRVFAKYFNRDSSERPTGGDAEDEWDSFRSGFRLDWREHLTLQGAVFKGDSGGEIAEPILAFPYAAIEHDDIENSGAHLLGRWEHTLDNGSDLAVQLYYDRVAYDMSYVNTTADTIDMEFNHRFHWGHRQEIMWGLGYRVTFDDIDSKKVMAIPPEEENYSLFSGFVQHQLYLLDHQLRLTMGSKFEHNDYSGIEIQPSARLLWSPEAQSYALWTSVSRAVRTPSRAEDHLQLDLKTIPPGVFLPDFPGAGMVRTLGSEDLDAEELLAVELGFRLSPAENLSLDAAVFYNVYDKLRTGSSGMPYIDMSTGVPLMIVPAIMNNDMDGDSYGFEIAADWIMSPILKFKAAYSYLKVSLDMKSQNVEDSTARAEEGGSPRNQVSLMSSLTLPGKVELDVWARYVDSLGYDGISSYITADVRLGWHVTDTIELSVTGQNLLDPSHPEFVPQFLPTVATEVERSVYGKIAVHF